MHLIVQKIDYLFKSSSIVIEFLLEFLLSSNICGFTIFVNNNFRFLLLALQVFKMNLETKFFLH